MKKIFKRVFKIILVAFFAGILTIVVIILFPQRLFAYKIKYKEFTVCSSDKIDNNINTLLDNAMNLVQKSELYDSGYKYNIILCHNTFYNRIDDWVLGIGPAARARFNNVVIKVRIDPGRNLAFPTFRRECEINLSYLLAHEMIHCLQAKKYGIIKFNPFRHPEFWKLEGYPEYISRKPQLSGKDYSLESEIERYVNLKSKATGIWIFTEEDGCETPDYYYRGRLMIEYLMDIKRLSYDQILKDSVSENTVFKEMIKWKDSIRKIEH